MPDDESPSRNPFIKFKHHVDSRIGTGLSVLTGGSSKAESATTSASKAEFPQPVTASMDSSNSKPPTQSSWVGSLLGRGLAPHDALAESATRRYWDEWAQLSPYSPYNLRHLDAPVPAGVSHDDAQYFDFEDAFEDLLAASQGQSLMDLRKQADYKRKVRETYLFGEPPMLWVNRLINRRLLQAPLPPRHFQEQNPEIMASHVYSSEILKGVEAQQERLKKTEALPTPDEADQLVWEQQAISSTEAQQERLKNIQSQRRELMGAVAPDDLTRHIQELKEKLLKELDQDITFNPATILRQFELLVKQLDHGLATFDTEKMRRQAEEMLKSLDKQFERFDPANMHPFDKYTPKDDDEDVSQKSTNLESKPQDQKNPKPDTEEDFFSAIFSALSQAHTSSTKQPNDSAKENSHQYAQTAHSWPSAQWDPPGQHATKQWEEEEVNSDGSKMCTHVAEYTDPSGAVHEKTVVRVLDANGNEVNHETTVFVNRSPRQHHPEEPIPFLEQLVLLERQNKARLEAVRKEKDSQPTETSATGSGGKPATGWFWR